MKLEPPRGAQYATTIPSRIKTPAETSRLKNALHGARYNLPTLAEREIA